jgi:thiol-disulfide isomerase/thioredoxin
MRFTMPRVAWGVVLAVAVIVAAREESFAAGELPPPRLQMVNGDYYSGQLKGSDEAGVVAWQSDDVVEPLRFALSSIAAAHFQRAGEPLRPQGEFCIELAGGDALFGTLLSLTAEHLELETANFGRVRIARDQVVRLEPWGDTSGIEYMGPEGLVGWTVTGGSSGEGAENGWREDAGHPLTLQPGTLSMPGVAIPAQASLELELSWRNKADFSLQFGTERDAAKLAADVAQFQGNGQPAMNGPAVPGMAPAPVREEPPTAFEVAIWGDSAVLVREQEQQADLARLERLASGAGRLALRLYLDQDAGVVSAYTVEGKFLASVKADGNGGKPAQGIRIINKRGDLRLERLVIRRWGGAAPQELAAGKSHLQLRDGTALDGAGAEFDGEKREFVVTADGQERRVPMVDVAGLTMGGAGKMPECTLRLSLHDGVRLNGNLERVTDDEVVMARPGIEPALEVPLDLVRSLIGLKPRAPENQPDGPRLGRLETASSVSHGLLVPVENDGGGGLAWRPFGSVTACALREGLSGRIVYRTPPPAIAAQSPQQRPAAAQNRGVWGALVGSFQAPAGGNAGARGDAASYNQLLWLRAGDRIPCIVKSIDERGVTFATPVLEATFLPHESIKAWDCVAGSQPRALEPQKMTRLLTLPRMQRENPPTHLIESTGGDFLRGRVESLDDKLLRIEVRLETKEIPRSQIARIIWFEKPPKPEPPAADAPAAGAADAGATAADATVTPGAGPGFGGTSGDDLALAEKVPQHANDGVSAAIAASKTVVQAICRDGVRLTFLPERLADEALVGASELLGPCSVPLAEVDQLYFGAAILSAAEELTYSVWRLYPAPDPKFVTEDGAPVNNISGLESSLVGQPAPDFKLEFADQGQFQLSEQRGHVVVLDFWASWCGPCMQAMPEVDALARDYGDRISLIAVNLQEDRTTIAAALERLGIQPRVVLDIDGAAAEKFGVTAIPQTVVIDAEGKVVRVFIGGGPNLVTDLKAAIDESLGEPASP